MSESAIPQAGLPDHGALAAIPIEESNEPLAPLGLSPEQLIAHPAYYLAGVPDAVPHCHARAGVFERLLAASSALPNGLRLVVLDAWRPYRVQQRLYEELQNVLRERLPDTTQNTLERRTQEFVAFPSQDPAAPSPHLTGGSVDVTLADRQGRMLAMGSAFDEVTERSHTGYYEGSGMAEEPRQNRRLLYRVMTEAGFTNLPSEWWHYDFGNQQWAWYQGANVAVYGRTEVQGLAQRWRHQLGS